MLGAEGPLTLWASLLSLQLARASLGFPPAQGLLFLTVPKGRGQDGIRLTGASGS